MSSTVTAILSERWQTLAIVLLPIVYNRIGKPLYNRLVTASTPTPKLQVALPPRTALQRTLSFFRIALLLAALAYTFVQGYLFRPVNLFTRLHLPVTTPVRIVEATLYQHDPTPSPSTLLLISKLKSEANRIAYMRVGQHTLVDCFFCQSRLEYQLYSIPRVLGQYLSCLVVLGISTMNPRRTRWRSYCVAVLAGCALMEMAVQVQDWQKDIPINDNLHLARHASISIALLLALFLPAASHLPTTLSSKLAPTLISVLQKQELQLNRLHSLAIQRRATMRIKELRDAQGYFEDVLKKETEEAMRVDGIQETKERLGVDSSGKQRGEFRAWVEALFKRGQGQEEELKTKA